MAGSLNFGPLQMLLNLSRHSALAVPERYSSGTSTDNAIINLLNLKGPSTAHQKHICSVVEQAVVMIGMQLQAAEHCLRQYEACTYMCKAEGAASLGPASTPEVLEAAHKVAGVGTCRPTGFGDSTNTCLTQYISLPEIKSPKSFFENIFCYQILAPPQSNMKKITLQATEASRMERRGSYLSIHDSVAITIQHYCLFILLMVMLFCGPSCSQTFDNQCSLSKHWLLCSLYWKSTSLAILKHHERVKRVDAALQYTVRQSSTVLRKFTGHSSGLQDLDQAGVILNDDHGTTATLASVSDHTQLHIPSPHPCADEDKSNDLQTEDSNMHVDT
ncbi:hypothetical protein F5J12DRAFT_779147 [Pisolithus orientalis]|uniref:uncharacterized protein n=1 Tax=Pisolithus orientalis TaxID=936130 RepID=UPI0022253590|nr:uncharacterized protein F5J12DRAFT_779147 [Pisolithus orientalis]KAI6032697.1 hypothetical protein F5J12DRAFT_779147 [Pisolithus orientalis]